MNTIRRQLTLFIDEPSGSIEKIRAEFNPIQYQLIPAHVTLCREDEIEPIDKTIKRIESIVLKKPIGITFGKAKRFANGNGVYMNSIDNNNDFNNLRKLILGQSELEKTQIPHITLMHPRNSTCTNDLFEKIGNYKLPTELSFAKISLIQQINGGKWSVLQEFNIVKNTKSQLGL